MLNMNRGIVAVLFAVVFAIAAMPFLLVQPSASASAWLTEGFMHPIASGHQVMFFLCIGIISAWLGEEAMAMVPLSTMLMLAIGVMMHVDARQFPSMTDFVVGAILLFSLSVSMLRSKAFLLCIAPIAVWSYFAGSMYMDTMSSTAPLYFLQGIIVSAVLIMAIGVCLGVTLSENVQELMRKLRHLPRVMSFLSLF